MKTGSVLVARLSNRSYEQMRVMGALVPGNGCLQRFARELRHVFGSADLIVGHRPHDVRDGDRPEPPPGARAPEKI